MKITMKQAGAGLSIKGAFEDFAVSQMAKGVSDKTVKTYYAYFRPIGKHLDTSLTFDVLKQTDLDRMIVSMRKSGLAHNSISSYLRVFRTFLNWCAGQGYISISYPSIREARRSSATAERQRTIRKRPMWSMNCPVKRFSVR